MAGFGEQQEIPRILIVEDDAAQRLILSDILQDEGFDTVAFGTAGEALDGFRKGRFEVAILDHRLPDLTGIQVLERIRAADDLIQVVMHTAYGSFDSARDSVNLGAFAYVEKAGDPEELVRQVHRALRANMRQALLAREESLRLLESALEQALIPVAVTTVSPEGSGPRFVYVNPAFTRMTGYGEEELLGRSPSMLYGLKTSRTVLDRLEALMSQGRSFVGDLILYRKDGRTFAIEVRIDAVRDIEGRITHWVAIYR